MNDTAIPGLLKAAGIDALRYPGGSYSDIYNWQTGARWLKPCGPGR
jgi:alpha-L-arabinofuranosidase